MVETMRVMGATRDGVEMSEIPKPTPGRGEVRVKVIASAVNAGEAKVISGDLLGRFLHAKTSPLVLGWDFAGTVDALGDGVTDIDEGTAVWGHLAYSMSQKQGAFAEHITMPREALAAKPDDVPYHVVAATPTVALTGLQSLRNLGRLSAGRKALIIGAGGGIGSLAVGIGKRLGGHVTGVCSTKDIERVEALGADSVIDRVQVASRRADLELVGGWLSEGLEVPIDSRHKIADLGVALKRRADRGRVGRVVVDAAEGWPS